MLATVIVLVLITALGFLSRWVLGQYFGGLAERFIQSIPGVNTVYNTVKQIVDTFSSQHRNLFSKVVLVEFPHRGADTIGFLTGKVRGERGHGGDGLWSVFVPDHAQSHQRFPPPAAANAISSNWRCPWVRA